MTYNYNNYQSGVEDESRYDLSGMAGFADRSEDQVNDAPEADPFTQGKAATGNPSNPYGTRAEYLKSQAEAVSADAMATLNRALKNQQTPEVSTGQGLTAALLAAVPAIGGAIIGNSMKTKLPAGTFGADIKPVSAGSMGMAGLDSGLKAAGGYLKSFEPSKEENDTLLRLAEYKNRQAQTLLQSANAAELQGMNQEQINQRQQNYLQSQKDLAANRPAAKATESEIIAKAMDGLKQTNPQMYQKVIGKEPLTPEERLQLPPELIPVVLANTQQKKRSYFDEFSPAQQDTIRKSKFVVDKARSLSDDLAKAGYSWAKYQTMRGLSAADTEGIGLELKYLADSLARARSGAALNKEEVILYNAMVGGDKTVDPRRAAMLLRKLSDIEAQSVMAFEPLMAAQDKESFFSNFAPSAPIATPQDKIAANNAKIAELKALLQQSKGLPK